MPEPQDILNRLAEYYRDFSTLDLDKITPYFHKPALFIAAGGMGIAADETMLRSILTRTVDDLRSRNYERSEFILREFRILNASTCLAQGLAVRYRSGGQELERVRLTYVLYLTEDWQIAVMIIEDHD
ncbi:MAG: hypothetical protein JOZ62_09160 [Acidobacteriaceae bacterium]|nr:hypothetical protein [Acidobacteriaceae bacterium]